MADIDPERVPVIVGVGQVNDRPEDPETGMDSVDLMAEALRRADTDAGGGFLAGCDDLAVVRQISFPNLSPSHTLLAERLGISPVATRESDAPNGDTPTKLLSEAANLIGSGKAKICAVAGGEALRTAGALAAARRIADTSSEAAGNPTTEFKKPNVVRDSAHRRRQGYAPSYGLVAPVDVYPLLENALRASLGQDLASAQQESARLWAGMSSVAAQNESAWLRKTMQPADIVTPSASNRPISYPYTKLQVANMAVNQGAAFIVTSLAEARRRGVPEDRLVYPGYGAGAAEAYDALIRERYDCSPSMQASIEGAMEANEVTSDDLAHVELYSCFPCIPKMASQILGWAPDKPITVFGGLTFGGGPIGNYMSHAIAEMVKRLRGTRDKGLLFGNGGAYATHNHTILLSGAPTGARFPQDFDYQGRADKLRGPLPPVEETYRGPAIIETYTVFYERDGSVRAGIIVARTPDGGRTLARVDPGDVDTIAFLTNGKIEPVGTPGVVEGGTDEIAHWNRA